MNHVVRLYSFLVILIIGSLSLQAKQNLDSTMLRRSHQLTDYYRFKDGMKERTWINMVNLNNKALQLIETDNLILENYLEFEMNRVGELNSKLEKANLEILLMNREIEVNSLMLEEQRFLNSSILIFAGIATILFVIVLILFIDRQIRFRSTRMELERFWAKNDDPFVSDSKNIDIASHQKELAALTEQNLKVKKQLEELSIQKRTQDSELKKEIDSRKEIESEIKLLLSQIKNLS